MLYNLSLPLLYPIFLLHQLCYIIFPSLYYIPIFLLHQLCYIIFPSLYHIPFSCCINYVMKSFPPFTISHIFVASIMLYNLSLPFLYPYIFVASIMLYNLSLPLPYPLFLLHQLCYEIFPSLYYIPYSCCINYVI